MAKSARLGTRILRTAMLGATALAAMNTPLVVGEAAARVGVTSATDGDPLGKPPQEAERVLRIGIDVQANELITTNANDRAHLLFLDGSSLTVGPNAQLTIDKFVFDPNTKTGELSINATKGVLRMVGGKISKNTPINITTPSSTIGIRGGITILDVKNNQTDSTFVFGKDMTVRGAGQTQVATRPGSVIVTHLGSAPGLPAILAQGALAGQLGVLEGRRSPQGGGGGGGGNGGARGADQAAQTSGLSTVNSGQAVRIVAPGVTNNFGSGPGPSNRNPSETIPTALSNANQGVQTVTAIQDVKQQQQQQQQQQTEVPAPALPPPPTAVPTAGQQPGGQQPTGAPPLGSQPVLTNLPQTGVATYVGGMVGIVNGHAISAGSYQNVWNFGANQGTVSARFQGADFQGSTVGGARGTFSTPSAIQSNNVNGRRLELNGTFFGHGSQPSHQVGNFKITGNGNYQVNGIFAGEKGR